MALNLESKVCIVCDNTKPVNISNNRLVTELCGHVKCMECLSDEKTGCSVCLKVQVSENSADDSNLVILDIENPVEDKEVENNSKTEAETVKKKSKAERAHIKIETDANGKYYFCTICQKKFHARSQVGYHVYCNGQRKPYQCSECPKGFATHSHFKYHMMVHRNERCHRCEVCGKTFLHPAKLQRHKQKHSGIDYSCMQCGKKFSNGRSLRNHAIIHSADLPFTCNVCGRRFRDQSNFKKHVDRHDAARNIDRRVFQCARCPQAFRSKKDLRRHCAVHTDSKPFRCKVCDRRFRRKDNLERHIRNTHPDHVPTMQAVIHYDDTGTNDTPAKETTAIENNEIDDEQITLKLLNPLPPLSQEVIQKHMNSNNDKTNNDELDVSVDKSFIIEANNARESVIFGPVKKQSSPLPETNDNYVHKIKKPYWASQKDTCLPPVSMTKIYQLETLRNFDVGLPPKKNIEVLKKILKSDKSEVAEDIIDVDMDVRYNQSDNPNQVTHWKSKLKQNMNWYVFY